MESSRSDYEPIVQSLHAAQTRLRDILEALRGGEIHRDYGEAERSVVREAITLVFQAGQISLDMSRSMRARMADMPEPASEEDIVSLLSLIDRALVIYLAADDDHGIPGSK